MKSSKITSIDFLEDLRSPYARKRFFWGFLLLCLLCSVLLYFVSAVVPIGLVQDVLNSVLIQILSSSIIILFFYVLYLHFIGPNIALDHVTVTRPQDIGLRMLELPIDVRQYIFWGRSGSYFRAHPLLKLDEQAKLKKRNIDIEVVLPDPDDPQLIKSYEDILVSLGETPSRSSLLCNVLATSLACAILSSNNKFLKIRIYYSKFLPTFRVDLSDQGAILTQDDKGKSALFFDYGSEFYDMFRGTIRNEIALSREVKWDPSIFQKLTLNEKSCNKTTLTAFGLKINDLSEVQQQVASFITKRPHRYK